MAQFVVQPATVDDLLELAEIFCDAFAENAEFKIMNRNVKREDMIEGDAKGYKKSFDWPGRKFFKAVEVDTG